MSHCVSVPSKWIFLEYFYQVINFKVNEVFQLFMFFTIYVKHNLSTKESSMKLVEKKLVTVSYEHTQNALG